MNTYFSDNVIEPVQILAVPRCSNRGESKLTFEGCVNLNDMKRTLTSLDHQDSAICFISVCQRNSWSPLQITSEMLDFIVSHHDLNDSVYGISSCFYTRNLDLEDLYCAPLSIVQSGDVIDISYTLRYPEFKEKENQWALRQSGIYQRFNKRTNQHFLLLFSPLPNSATHAKIWNQLRNEHPWTSHGPFWVHAILFSTYFPTWRQYMAWLEGRLIPITNLTMIAEINRELRVSYEQLNTMYALMNKLFQVSTLMSHSLDVFENLLCLYDDGRRSSCAAIQQLQNYWRQAAAYSRTAAGLNNRAQTTAQLLSSTLSLREQTISKDEADRMATISKSTYWITIMGLLYLPTTLVATVFGTSFFNFDSDRSRIVVSTDIWYFFVVSGGLTFITLFTCYGFGGYGMISRKPALPTSDKWKITSHWRMSLRRDKEISNMSSV
ncbi:hypothetical protein F5B22DRAFT_656612 [Xylaria bambusicola]|uniref:uncharacterized protein n=1 Tax=Xylaria bambusicola TaxID=326684 RepID=UPI002007E828|nr:uncharacterized protein F5B22DRAFT_656612 [Xylaria bambusicola]KAI0514629.1 hypothetical protein F5B22DRAFT_656612 [Xylaria bambusicola]